MILVKTLLWKIHLMSNQIMVQEQNGFPKFATQKITLFPPPAYVSAQITIPNAGTHGVVTGNVMTTVTMLHVILTMETVVTLVSGVKKFQNKLI